jgi:DNA primase
MQTIYQIRDMLGSVVAEHVRTARDGKKSMYWRQPNGTTGLGVGGSEALPLYGAHRLNALPVGATVVVAEGEKATEAAWQLGWPAVGTVTGASSTPGEYAIAVLLPFDVVTWEDFDDPGREHMARVVARLRRLGGDARRLRWGQQKGDDAADFLAAGIRTAVLDSLIRLAPPWHDVQERQAPKPARVAYRSDSGRIDTARAQLFDVVCSKLGAPAITTSQGAWWRCPFHTDNTPSFKVDIREPFFRCFGCSARGDVFIFLRQLDGNDFKTALQELAPTPALGGIRGFGA